MTPELKDKLYKFLWDESMLYDEEEMKLIEKWIDENILKDFEELQTQNTNLLNSLASVNEVQAQLALLNTESYDSVKKSTAALQILVIQLRQSVELIKKWHSIGAKESGKSKEVIEEIWHTYYDHAPEMKFIREILKEEK